MAGPDSTDPTADLQRYLRNRGAVGLRADNDNLAAGDPACWQSYRERLEQVARAAGRA